MWPITRPQQFLRLGELPPQICDHLVLGADLFVRIFHNHKIHGLHTRNKKNPGKVSDQRGRLYTMSERTCTDCGRKKPETTDHFYKRSRGGFYGNCKTCYKRRNAVYQSLPNTKILRRKQRGSERSLQKQRAIRATDKGQAQLEKYKVTRLLRDPMSDKRRHHVLKLMRYHGLHKPDRCSSCKKEGRVVAFHANTHHAHWDEITWLCYVCDKKAVKKRDAIEEETMDGTPWQDLTRRDRLQLVREAMERQRLADPQVVRSWQHQADLAWVQAQVGMHEEVSFASMARKLDFIPASYWEPEDR